MPLKIPYEYSDRDDITLEELLDYNNRITSVVGVPRSGYRSVSFLPETMEPIELEQVEYYPSEAARNMLFDLVSGNGITYDEEVVLEVNTALADRNISILEKFIRKPVLLNVSYPMVGGDKVIDGIDYVTTEEQRIVPASVVRMMFQRECDWLGIERDELVPNVSIQQNLINIGSGLVAAFYGSLFHGSILEDGTFDRSAFRKVPNDLPIMDYLSGMMKGLDWSVSPRGPTVSYGAFDLVVEGLVERSLTFEKIGKLLFNNRPVLLRGCFFEHQHTVLAIGYRATDSPFTITDIMVHDPRGDADDKYVRGPEIGEEYENKFYAVSDMARVLNSSSYEQKTCEAMGDNSFVDAGNNRYVDISHLVPIEELNIDVVYIGGENLLLSRRSLSGV